LESISLGAFKQTFERHGNNEGAELIAEIAPGVRTYLDNIVSLKGCPQAKLTISELIRQ